MKRHWGKWIYTGLMVLLLASLAACAGEEASPTPTPRLAENDNQPLETLPAETPTLPGPGTGQARTLTIMTHDSFAMSEEVRQAFESEHNAQIEIFTAGDTGTALNQAILSKNNPLADVLYGVDNTYLSRALEEEIFDPYESPFLDAIPDEFELDPQHFVSPVDYGDVCLNYDKTYLEEQGIEAPQNLEDLLEPEYKGLLVVENPASSSPGLAFLLATIGHFGEDGYLEYWRGLVENDVLVVNDWNTAYYSEFTATGQGTRPIVVSYGSSPPFEVIYAEQPIEEPSTAVVTGSGSCFRQIEFVGILKGTENHDLAEAWVDFMLSETFQEDLPLQMFVFPVNPEAELDETFQKFLAIPDDPAEVSSEDIAENRERWIQAWTEVVLR